MICSLFLAHNRGTSGTEIGVYREHFALKVFLFQENSKKVGVFRERHRGILGTLLQKIGVYREHDGGISGTAWSKEQADRGISGTLLGVYRERAKTENEPYHALKKSFPHVWHT